MNAKPAATGGRPPSPQLKRSVGLAALVLYGLGTTIGAGIYVLIGETALRAGFYAPLAFVVAAIVVSFTAATYSELSGSFPVSAGEAAYVRAGFGIERLALVVGLLVAGAGIVSSATLVQGAAGYAQNLAGWPESSFIVGVTLAIGLAVAVGINLSVGTAVIFTLIEVAGLLLIIGAGFTDLEAITRAIRTHVTAFGPEHVTAVLSAGLLSFFAFIGFEDLVNMAEEIKKPERTLPWAIGLVLVITTVIYVGVAIVAVTAIDPAELGASDAPLTLVFERISGLTGAGVSAIAIIAALNGMLAQIVMASRVLYGLSRMHDLPDWFGIVNATTRTPLNATIVVVGVILLLALLVPLGNLAEITSSLTLLAFALVNLSLWRLKGRPSYRPGGISVARWVPLAGFTISLMFLAVEIIRRVTQ